MTAGGLSFFFSFSVYASSFCVFFLCECILWSQFLMFISSICWHYRFSKWFTWIVCLGCVNLFFTLNSLEKTFVDENHLSLKNNMEHWLLGWFMSIISKLFIRWETGLRIWISRLSIHILWDKNNLFTLGFELCWLETVDYNFLEGLLNMKIILMRQIR